MERNSNHPKKGESCKVEPITNLESIKKIKEMLSSNPRDLLIFTLGINTNLRASDIVSIKVGQVAGLEPGDSFEIREKKTDKTRRITLNEACVKVLREYLNTKPFQREDFLFKTFKSECMEARHVHKLVKKWCREAGLKGNYGSHTLRKTWGYHQRTSFKTDIPTLMACFNHNTQRQTLEYLCIQPAEIQRAYQNII